MPERETHDRAARERLGVAPAWWRRLTWPAWELALEPVRRAHAPMVRRSLTSEIAQWLGVGTVDEMRAGTLVWASESDELARRGSAFRYLMMRRGRFTGAIEVRPDAIRGHIGYWLRRSARGQGTATLANRLILTIAFEGLGLLSVDWTADARNAASIAIMKRLGGRLIATIRTEDRSGREFEVRYRLSRDRYERDMSGPSSLRFLIRASDNAETGVVS